MPYLSELKTNSQWIRHVIAAKMADELTQGRIHTELQPVET